MDPLARRILEPENLECWKYLAIVAPGLWNGGTRNLAAETESPVNKNVTRYEAMELMLFGGSYCSHCVA